MKRNQIAHTATERDILQNLNHPFLCELQFAFQSKDKLYMVLEFMPGGELFFWLKQQRRFSAHSQSTFPQNARNALHSYGLDSQ